ncbi:MAG TPA: hypothetical protein QGF95_18465 [Candidatus Latescibacteria bacterium]|nr:hypothetical protein [Candidatus Latescibacterota bacterium]HJP32533.1 hypothetical protein [Candidatus Latescibacterota bacterium]
MSDDPIIRPEDREDEQLIDCLFELYGYPILKEAVAPADITHGSTQRTIIQPLPPRRPPEET